jgi:hypothetical protein
LLKGRELVSPLAQPEQFITSLFFLAAGAAAAVASFYAIKASNSSAEQLFLPGGRAVREATESSVKDSLGQLAVTRQAAMTAAILLILAAGVLIFGRADQKSAQELTPAELCIRAEPGSDKVVLCPTEDSKR